MLNDGYAPAFVAGMIANIVFEGDTGRFENSNYIVNPKPDYLNYMDTKFNGENFYLNNYSNKTIMDVNVVDVHNILKRIDEEAEVIKDEWWIGNTRAGYVLCKHYIIPDEDFGEISTDRANLAELIYDCMIL